MSFHSVYVPIGVPTFDQAAAGKAFAEAAALLRGLDATLDAPEKPLLGVDAVAAFLEDKTADLVVIENVTFANGAYMSEILHRFPDVPVVLWTLREPVVGDGGRLRFAPLEYAGDPVTQFGLLFYRNADQYAAGIRQPVLLFVIFCLDDHFRAEQKERDQHFPVVSGFFQHLRTTRSGAFDQVNVFREAHFAREPEGQLTFRVDHTELHIRRF